MRRAALKLKAVLSFGDFSFPVIFCHFHYWREEVMYAHLSIPTMYSWFKKHPKPTMTFLFILKQGLYTSFKPTPVGVLCCFICSIVARKRPNVCLDMSLFISSFCTLTFCDCCILTNLLLPRFSYYSLTLPNVLLFCIFVLDAWLSLSRHPFCWVMDEISIGSCPPYLRVPSCTATLCLVNIAWIAKLIFVCSPTNFWDG